MVIKYDRAVFILIALLPFSTIPKILLSFDFFPIFFDVCLLFLLCFGLVRGKLSGPKSTVILIFIYLVFNVVTILWSQIPVLYSNVTAIRLTLFPVLMFFLPYCISLCEDNLEYFSRLLLLCSVFVFLNAVRQYVFPLDVEVSFANDAGGAAKFYGDSFQGALDSFRIFSTFITSVHLVTYTSFVFYLFFSFYILRVKTGTLLKVSMVLALISLILTFSRAGWLSFLFGFLICFFFSAHSVSVFNKIKIILMALFSFTLLILFIENNELLSSRVYTLGSLENVSSFQSRLLVWEERINLIYQNPYGLGVGAASWSVHHLMHAGADSNYLKFFIELGFAGGVLSLFVLIYSYFYILIGVISFKRKNSINYAFVVSIFAFFNSTLIQMIANQVLEAYPINMYFWFLIGVGVILVQGRNSGENNERS